MEIDTSLTLVNLVALGSSVVSAGAVYGIMREKLRYVEDELKRVKDNTEKESETVKDKFVAFAHFKDVVSPMQASINEIQNDVKKLLLIQANLNNGGPKQ